MAACSLLPGGTLVRWHYPTLDECAEAKCERRHATKAELDTFTDEAVAFRAGAMCAASEPHGVAEDDWPCPACLARVRSASALASTVISGLPGSAGAVDGGPDRAPGPPSGQVGASALDIHNRARDTTPGPAEGAAATARIESMP